jgi:hypothetical protein
MRGRVATAVDTNSKGTSGTGLPARRRSRLAQLCLAACTGRPGTATLVVLLLCLVGAPAAQAQSNTSTNRNTGSSLTPITSPNGVLSLVPNAQGIERGRPYYSISRPWWISFADCFANDTWTFSLSVRDVSNPIEIWAGTENCATNRSRTDRGQCWIVARVSQPEDTVDIRVPVRNVVARRLDTTLPPENVGAEVCDDSTDPSGESVTFYFLVEEGGQADEYFSWDASDNGGTGFDTLGPDPPGNISVGIGESQLSVAISNVDEEPDRDRFEAFCVPEGAICLPEDDCDTDPSGPGIVDAGGSFAIPDAGDAGLDASSNGGGSSGSGGGSSVNNRRDAGGTPAPAECFTEVLRSDRRPPPRYSCGTASETARTLNTSVLTNGVTYAVAVAGQDNIGNAGVASDIQCGTPIPLDDFFELYSRRGGPGGGGFCSFSPPRPASGTYGATLLGLLFVGFAARRVRGRS